MTPDDDLVGIWPKGPVLEGITATDIAELLEIPLEDTEPAQTRKSSVSFGGASDWPQIEPLSNELPPVPAFDPALLPESLRIWCIDVATRMQTPLDFPAAAAIAALGSVCMRRVMIQPKRLDSGWRVVPIIWGGLIGEPGTKKTPTIGEIFSPLLKIQESWMAEYKGRVAEKEIEAERQHLRLQAYREEYKRHSKGKAAEPTRPEVSAEAEPQRKWLIASDVTYEALSEILAQNQAGISILRDELPAWLQTFERQGREADRAFFLEAWCGHNPFSSSRIGRGVTDVRHCAVGVFGGIQPNRLRSYLNDVQQDDGLFQRFQVLVWPDYPRDTGYVDAIPNSQAQRNAVAVFGSIAAMDATNPLTLQFAPDAQKLFSAWLPALDSRVLSDDMAPALRAHLAKYRSLMPAISLLLSLADGCLESVSIHHAKMAAGWCEYLEAHARRVYSEQITPEQVAAHSVAKRITRGWKRADGCFTLREVYRANWAGVTTPDEARAALNVLCEYGWVRKVPVQDAPGRPSETYEINPHIPEVK